MQDNPKLSGWLDRLLNTSLQIAPVAYGMYAQNQMQGQATSQQQAQVTQAIDSLVLQLNQLEVGFAALNSSQRLQAANQALQAAGQILAAFNQIPATGSNATYLANSKRVGQAVLNHIQQMIQQAQSGTTTGNAPTTPTTPVITEPNTTTTPINTAPTNNAPSAPINGQPIIYQTSLFGGLSEQDKKYLIYGTVGIGAILLLK